MYRGMRARTARRRQDVRLSVSWGSRTLVGAICHRDTVKRDRHVIYRTALEKAIFESRVGHT